MALPRRSRAPFRWGPGSGSAKRTRRRSRAGRLLGREGDVLAHPALAGGSRDHSRRRGRQTQPPVLSLGAQLHLFIGRGGAERVFPRAARRIGRDGDRGGAVAHVRRHPLPVRYRSGATDRAEGGALHNRGGQIGPFCARAEIAFACRGSGRPLPFTPEMSRPDRTILLDARAMSRALQRMAVEVLELSHGTDDLVLIGIQRRGLELAERIAKLIDKGEGVGVPRGALDLTLYRDGPRALE